MVVKQLSTRPCKGSDDPYHYCLSFGNHHGTEHVPGVLPGSGTNLPQQGAYGLYAELLNGTPFVGPRATSSFVWMYRGKPAAAHQPMRKAAKETHNVEATFLPYNDKITFTPLGHTWGPLRLPASATSTCHSTTFVQGLKTIGGHGCATLKEGLAVHQYAFNSDMDHQVFVNHDGELLLIPQDGVLDIKTELGNLFVKPGMIAVVPAGIRFSVSRYRLSDIAEPRSTATATGYALEIFGSQFALPELGPLGVSGLANPRAFEYPVASFELDTVDSKSWEIIVKAAGRFRSYSQPQTPFDVVAWHGKYAPYRYDLAHFGHLSANVDQLDPTASCVLTAPSRSRPGVSLVDFCIFGEKWAVSQGSLRIPYYHRTMATELCGVIRGQYNGSVRPLEAGGLSFEASYMPHGETYEAHQRETEAEHEPVKVLKDTLSFMFHIPAHFALTKWATEEHPDIREERPDVWDSMRNHFLDHIDDANVALAEANQPPLEQNIPTLSDDLGL
ncbi:putative homogentisate 1,2-dioxygenase [Podospora australis]|uniref:homogentisate 1,2-dioxygenase n=1 Tax=Podospora australis TaxID=1536484 RepID=A0AAN6WQK5_9PEZI|nr:putative homogentisate 1,2-dioxygenase [Podospora australis]